MRTPLEISFHGISRSESIEEIIRSDVAKLERLCDRLISCHVGVKLDQHSSVSGNPFRVRVEMRVPPGHTLVVTNTSGVKEAADDLVTTVKNTFKSAHRRLRQLVEKQQGAMKSHPRQEIGGIIVKMFSREGYGFLRSLDGEEIYFHQNSVVNDQFDQLDPGTGVSFTTELGDKGLQASSVQVIAKSPEHRAAEGGDVDINSPLGWQRQKI